MNIFKKARRINALLMSIVLVITSIMTFSIQSKAASQSSSNGSSDSVKATIVESKVNDYWYEYLITVSNTSESSICGWTIKANLPGVDVSDANSFDTCGLTYTDGYLYIKGQGDGSVVSSNSNNSAQNIKFGLGRSIGLDTSDIVEITYDYGSEVNVGGSSAECDYTLTGATKELSFSETPVGRHGALHVDGIYMYDEHNEKIQLRGASLHGLQWDDGYNYINKGAFQSLRDEWGINAVRLPVYVTQGGYVEGSASAMDTRIQNAVQYATELGMYVIIDWHVHSASGETTNPNTWKSEANTFFEKYASMYKDYNNIIYEICNEPVNTQWYDGSGNDLYSYANSVIPTIRKYTDAIVVVGTNTWSQDVDQVANNKLSTTNTMYTIHFYAATHMESLREKVKTALNAGVPVFCTEFGVCSADGNGSYNLDQANLWIDLFDEYSISYFCWQLSNKGEKASYLSTSCSKTTGGWTNSDLSVTGAWLINVNRPKADAESSQGGTGDDTPTTVAVTGVSLNQTSLTLDKGATSTLTATVAPSDATNKSVSWSTGDSNVATVDSNGKVTAKGAGKTTITVKTEDGSKTATCTVEVYETYAAPSAPTLYYRTSDSVTLSYMEGCEYSKDGTNWQSGTTFTGLTPNTTYTFYARKKASGYYKTSAASSGTQITTDKIVVTGVTLDKTSFTLDAGETATLAATVYPTNATDKTVTWSSSDTNVATVSTSGKVTAKGAGQTTITVKTTDGSKTATCTVTVWETPAAPSTTPSVENSGTTSITLEYIEGYEYRIKGGDWQDSNVFNNLEPGKEYTFEMRKKADADNYLYAGEITEVTASTLPEGTTFVEVTGVELNTDSVKLNMENNTTATLSAVVSPSNASDKSVKYYSSDENVAKVDDNGKITAAGPGKATITVKTSSQGKEDTCTVEVYKKYSTPSAPTVSKVTTDTVTLKAVSGCQYSKDGSNWQSSNVFKGLKEGTTYTFYIRKKASGYYTTSDKSKGTSVTTKVTSTEEPTTEAPTTETPTTEEPTTENPTDEEKEVKNVTVSYRTHVQSFGWQDFVSNGVMSGTSGLAKRLEGIEISVKGNNNVGIQYTTHCQSYGWLPWSANGEMNGTEGEAKRLEAIKIQLTGSDADKYDVYYRVHAQSYGWLGWAKNGEPSGTAGYAKRLEGIQIVVVKKGESINANMQDITSARSEAYIALAGSSPVVGAANTDALNPVIPGVDTTNVAYKTHVQSYGWQGWKYNGAMSGTSGEAKRLEGINIKLTNKQYEGGIAYTTHVQTYGWQGDVNNSATWKKDGEMSGTSGEAKRLEAICITLTGEMAEHYDVYYRVHAQSFGWLDWAKNGAPAGTAGYAKRLEGIEIVLVPKGGAAPGETTNPYVAK